MCRKHDTDARGRLGKEVPDPVHARDVDDHFALDLDEPSERREPEEQRQRKGDEREDGKRNADPAACLGHKDEGDPDRQQHAKEQARPRERRHPGGRECPREQNREEILARRAPRRDQRPAKGALTRTASPKSQ